MFNDSPDVFGMGGHVVLCDAIVVMMYVDVER